jgi:1-acyl-sn-glycerol-3-phosphate acyltransferase
VGAANLAKITGAPIIPARLTIKAELMGSDKLWKSLIIRSHAVLETFPMFYWDFDQKDELKLCMAHIQNIIEK